MPRSPHASYLNPKWGKDLAWMLRIGAIVEHPQLAGQMVIEPVTATVIATAPASMSRKGPASKRQPSSRTRKSKTPAIRPLPCVNLGAVVKRAGSCCPRNNTHTCNAGRGDVRPAIECETCVGYVADSDATD